MTKPWKEFRQEIVRLYIQEGRTLRDVQDIMRRQHGFIASIRSYRQQFDHWNVGKYKCKRKSRQAYGAGTGAIHPPSPPITPMLPPMSIPVNGQKPIMTSMSGEPASVDNCWPNPRGSAHFERDHRHGRSHSVSLPFYTPQSAVAPYVGTAPPSRPYHAPRATLPMMSTLVDETTPGWMHGRGNFAPNDTASRENTGLYVIPHPTAVIHSDESSCSPRDSSSFTGARDQLSPVYSESKAAFVDDPGWGISRPGVYPITDSDGPFHGDTILDSRPRSFDTDISSTPCSLVAAKGYAASNHLPLDRINIFGRDG